MKKISGLFTAFAMLLSMAFVANAASTNNPLSVQEQTRTGSVTVTKKKSGGIVGGAKYVAHKTKRGAIYVGKKTYQGGKYAAKKTYQGGKYVTTKTVKGTKYTAHKTKRGLKAITSRTKKVIVGNN
jgi:uncharacterized low-complexity protein